MDKLVSPKILYVSNWKESSGYSSAARNYIECMLDAGLDVIPRNITITGSRGEVSSKILQAEGGSAFGATHCIQHTLPSYFTYQGGLKNIGLFASESTTIKPTGWANKCDLMDEIWAINTFSKDCLQTSGVNVPVRVVPHAFNMAKYQTQYEPLELPILKDITVFYFIGEFIRRKALGTLVKAFHTAFGPNDRVMLLIKTRVNGQSPEQGLETVRKFCNDIKNGLRLYKDEAQYRPEIIITDHLSDHDVARLHKACHVYVTCSGGEAFDIPAFEAGAFGNVVIMPRCHADYTNNDSPFSIPFQEQIAFGHFDSLPTLYTARERFSQVNENELVRALKLAYKSKEERERQSQDNVNRSYDYSYEKIGLQIKDLVGISG